MKHFVPLELTANNRVIEQNKKFYWVVSASLYIRLSTGKVELMHDCISPIMDSMGSIPTLDPGMPKPQAEWLINGSYFSPTGQPVNADKVTAKVGNSSKIINVFGDREWRMGLPTSPSEFSSMPIHYELAFGGKELETNPDGIGYKQKSLPNIEKHNDPITSATDFNYPAGFSALTESLPQRRQFAGTYDQKYMQKYFPGYPADLDWRFFMNAPEDQWFSGFLDGDEHYEFTNLDPDISVIKGELPGFSPRCFINNQELDNPFEEISLNLDTAWFFPDKDIVQLIWRGGKSVSDDDAQSISHLLLAYEHKDSQKRNKDHYRYAMQRRIETKNSLDDSLNTSDLIPDGMPSAMEILMASALGKETDTSFADNMKTKADAIKDAVNEKVEGSIKDLKEKASDSQISKVEKDRIFDKLNSLEQEEGSDPAVDALMDKINGLLPGIKSGDISKLDFSKFSFSKLDDIFSIIDDFTETKKSEALKSIEGSTQLLFENSLPSHVGDSLPTDTISSVKDEIEKIESIISGESQEMVLLPRLDVEEIKRNTNLDSSDMIQAKKNLHIQLSNPLTSSQDEIENLKNGIKAMEALASSDFDESLMKAYEGFLESYRMGAHYMDNGLTPHESDDQRFSVLQKSLALKNVSNQDWACLDLSGMNLDQVDFSNCLMEQVNFSGCSLVGANFSGAILARSNFSGADLTGATFDYANLGGSLCHNTNFTRASFYNSKLSKSTFQDSNFSEASIVEPEALYVKVNRVNFDSAIIKNWPFLEVEINDCNFSNCEFETTNFVGSILNDCKFDRAKLPSSAWADCQINRCTFIYADMSGNCFVGTEDDKAKFNDLNFSGANLSKCNFQGMNFSYCNFKQSTLDSANFLGSDIRYSNFDQCSGFQTNLRKANMEGLSMVRANMKEAVFTKTRLLNADLSESNFYAVDFLRAYVSGTKFDHSNLDSTILKEWRPS